jgi:hypothetical protein
MCDVVPLIDQFLDLQFEMETGMAPPRYVIEDVFDAPKSVKPSKSFGAWTLKLAQQAIWV